MGKIPRKSAKVRKVGRQDYDSDGVDPRVLFSDINHRRKTNYRSHQLCRQVTEALMYVLSDGPATDDLSCLHVASVVPAPDSSRLLVVLWPDADVSTFDRERILAKLEEHRGRIRCEVAAAITRKKAPILIFQVLDPRVARSEAL